MFLPYLLLPQHLHYMTVHVFRKSLFALFFLHLEKRHIFMTIRKKIELLCIFYKYFLFT